MHAIVEAETQKESLGSRDELETTWNATELFT